jgi:hypothetical protein
MAPHFPPHRLVELHYGGYSGKCLHVSMMCASDVSLQFFFMPDSPVSVKWLNDRERAIAVQRVADHQLGVKNSTYKSINCSNAFANLDTDHLKWEQVSCYQYE